MHQPLQPEGISSAWSSASANLDAIGVKPDYHGGSIVNLMNGIALALDGEPAPGYPVLRDFEVPARGGPIVLVVLDGIGYEYVVLEAGYECRSAGHRGHQRSHSMWSPT